ncbi:MAG: leucine-rich repeat protein, partial [Huintestinicola sp.]
LKTYITENSAITPGQAVFLANEVSNALITAHNANVLHRDISPDNIMLCNDGTLKLLDFGAARQVIAEGSQSLSVILKQGYAPLEQYQKKGKQGPWTDIYSLAATLYHALTLDFLDDPMSRLEDDEEYSSNVHNIPSELWEIIKKATELKITDRYQDIYEFKEAFENISIKPEPFIKRDFKQQAEDYRKSAHSRTQAVKTEKPASDMTVPLKQDSSAPMDVTMPLKQDSSAPMDVTMPLKQSNSAPMDVTMPLNQSSSAPMDVTMPLNQSSSAPMDVTMPLNQSSSAEKKTPPPERKPRTESTSIFSDRNDPEADAYSEYEAEMASAKKKRIRLLCIIAAAAVIVIIMIAFATGEPNESNIETINGSSDPAQEASSGNTDDLEYRESSDGNIIITGLTDSSYAGDLVIADKIDGKPVVTIDRNAFNECDSLTSITLPDSVTTIRGNAFSGCDSLTSITIPDSVTSIGANAFNGCVNLTSISIPNSMTSIDEKTFYGCGSLTSITIPGGVTSIGEKAFYKCGSLTSVTIPGSVTSIGNEAFYKCDSLISVNIPDGVTSIGKKAFYSCGSLTSVSIPDSVTSIGSYAFYQCKSLTSLTLSNSVTSISYGTFYECSGLTSITIPDSVTYIGDNAFEYCFNLKDISIPAGCDVSKSAFGNAIVKIETREKSSSGTKPEQPSQPKPEESKPESQSNPNRSEPEQGIDIADITKAYVERMENTDNFYGYYLYDMDNDGLSELIVKRGNDFSDANSGMYEFYAYDEYRKSTILLGVYEFSHEELCLDKNDELVASGAWQGMWLRKIIYDGTKISTTDLYNLSMMATEEEMTKAAKDFPTHQLPYAEAGNLSLLDNIAKSKR